MPMLPLTGTWQVDLVETPSGALHLVVVDDADGTVRLHTKTEVGDDLAPLLQRAAEAPEQGRPERPKKVYCLPDLAPMVRPAVKALKGKVATKAVLDRVAGLQRALTTAAHHDLDTLVEEPARWKGLFDGLRAATDALAAAGGVVFRFAGSPALASLAVTPTRGGLRLHEHEAALQAHGSLYARMWSDVWTHVRLVAASTLPEAAQAERRAAGLSDGAVALAVSDEGAVSGLPLHPDDAPAQRAAVGAVLEALRAHGAALAEGPTQTVAATELGPVVVHSQPPLAAPAPTLLDGVERVVALVDDEDSGVTVLSVLVRRADAADLAHALDGVDALHAEPTLRGIALVAMAGGARRGVLAHARREWRGWLEGGAGQVEVVTPTQGGDGPLTPGDTADLDTVWQADVALTHALPEGGVQPVAYAGPVEAWPEPEAVLRAMLEPLELPTVPLEHEPNVVRWAVAAWNAGVMADHHGQPALLDTLLEVAPDGLVHRFQQHRRDRFPLDDRMLTLASLGRQGDRLTLTVAGRRLGGDA